MRAMPPNMLFGSSIDVRRSLHGGGESSLSSLPSAAPAASHSCCHLRLLCWARTVLRLQGPLGGSMHPAAAARQGCPVLAWPLQLSCRRLLRVLDRVHSVGGEVGVPATTIVPADPPLQLLVSSCCCCVSKLQTKPQPPGAAAGLGSCCCCSPTTSWAGGCTGRMPGCCAAAAGTPCCTAGCGCCCCWSPACCVRSCELLVWMGRGLRPSSLLRLTGWGRGLHSDSCTAETPQDTSTRTRSVTQTQALSRHQSQHTRRLQAACNPFSCCSSNALLPLPPICAQLLPLLLLPNHTPAPQVTALCSGPRTCMHERTLPTTLMKLATSMESVAVADSSASSTATGPA